MLLLYSCLQKNNLIGPPQIKLVFAISLLNQNYLTFTERFYMDLLRDSQTRQGFITA